MSEMDKLLQDTKVQFEAKTVLLRNILQEAETRIKEEGTKIAMKYKEKIQTARQQLNVREQGLKEWEGRLQKRDSGKLQAREAAIVVAEKEVAGKKLSIAQAQKALDSNRMELLDRRMQLDVREYNLNMKERDLVAQTERDAKLEGRRKDLEDEFARKMKFMEDEFAHKMKVMEERLREATLKVEAKELESEDDVSRKLKSLEEREANVEERERYLELGLDYALKFKSLDERETRLERQEKDVEAIINLENEVILREGKVRRMEESLEAKLEDQEWIDVDALIARCNEGNPSQEMQKQLATLKKSIGIVRKAGVIPVLRKSFTVTFQVGLKENADEGASAVVTSTGFDEPHGISILVKDMVKYIKSHYLKKSDSHLSLPPSPGRRK